MSESYTIELDQQPCVVEYVEKWASFLVGTYRLLPTIEDAKRSWPDIEDHEELNVKYESLNHRLGSLVLFSRSDVSQTYTIRQTIDCHHGGVFDFSIRDDEIYVAHANNTISLYEYCDTSNVTTKSNMQLVHRNSVKPTPDNSILLTSIDTCSIKTPINSCDRLYTAIGDSKGCLSVLICRDKPDTLGIVLDKCSISTMDDPIWQVRFVQPSHTHKLAFEQLFLIVGSENQSWFVFSFNLQSNQLKQIAKNQDFGAGVTSVCIMPQADHQDNELQLNVIIGSYDETIRKYSIELEANSRAIIKCTEKISIEGGGIWRINHREDNLYIAAMYAGCYRASCGNLESTLTNLTSELTGCRPASVANEQSPPLDYGIDVCQSHDIACVVDYNNRMCLFFKL